MPEADSSSKFATSGSASAGQGSDEARATVTESTELHPLWLTFRAREQEAEFEKYHFSRDLRLTKLLLPVFVVYGTINVLLSFESLVRWAMSAYVVFLSLALIPLTYVPSLRERYFRPHAQAILRFIAVSFTAWGLTFVLATLIEHPTKECPDAQERAENETFLILMHLCLVYAPFTKQGDQYVLHTLVFVLERATRQIWRPSDEVDASITGGIVLRGVVAALFVFISWDRQWNRRLTFLVIRRLRKENIAVRMRNTRPGESTGPASQLTAMLRSLLSPSSSRSRTRLTAVAPEQQPKLTWEVAPDAITWGPLLGSGAFGEVFLCHWRGTQVAAKKIRGQLHQGKLETFVAELSVLQALRHPNIVLFMGACLDPANLLLVTEYMSKGSLADLIHDRGTQISEGLAVNMAYGAAKGMAFLHSNDPRVLHQDLKSANVLVDVRWSAKVADFGISALRGESGPGVHALAPMESGASEGGARRLVPMESGASEGGARRLAPMGSSLSGGTDGEPQVVGSLPYMAPEVLLGRAFGKYSDVYSFAMILWELASREAPFEEQIAQGNPAALINMVANQGVRPQMPPMASPEYAELIERCWNADPLERLPFTEIVNSLRLLGGDMDPAVMQHETFVSGDGSSMLEVSKPEWKGSGALVVVQIASDRVLWASDPQAMRQATETFLTVARSAILQMAGRELAFEEGVLTVAFQRPHMALDWAKRLQLDLVASNWPASLKTLPACRAVRNDTGDFGAPTFLFNGVRARVALHWGAFRPRRGRGATDVSSSAPSTSLLAVPGADGEDGALSTGAISTGNRSSFAAGDDPALMLQGPTFAHARTHILESAFGGEILASKAFMTEITSEAVEDREIKHVLEMLPATRAGKPTAGLYQITPTPLEGRQKVFSGWQDDPLVMADAHGDQDWIVEPSELTMERRLGSGNFGEVFVAKFRGQEVAVKRLLAKMANERRTLSFYEEICLMRMAHHENVVKFLGATVKLPFFQVIMELVDTDLSKVIKTSHASLTSQLKIKIIRGIALGLQCLHGLHIIHRDIKPANILLTGDYTPKLTDFGLGRIRADAAKTMTRCGSVYYCAPEVLEGKRYHSRADVYSFGIVCWQIENGRSPYTPEQHKGNLGALAGAVVRGERPVLSWGATAYPINMISTMCWVANPDQRPDIADVLPKIDAAEQTLAEIENGGGESVTEIS